MTITIPLNVLYAVLGFLIVGTVGVLVSLERMRGTLCAMRKAVAVLMKDAKDQGIELGEHADKITRLETRCKLFHGEAGEHR